ncbi:MAG: acyl-CoA dehydrogenase, partial [Acidobacteria bacterium]
MASSNIDFMKLDEVFTDEEKLVRDSVREFVDQNVLPIIEEHYQAGKFPMQLVKPMGDLGYFGANLNGYGCAGLNNVAYGLIMQELERGDSGLRSFVSVQGALVMYPIYSFGSDEQKDRWLPRLQSGQAIGCFGLTEPDFGSNPSGMRTRARREADCYVLQGSKAWITNGTLADVALVWARCEDEKIRGFLVEKGTPGFEARDYHNKHSLRASV